MVSESLLIACHRDANFRPEYRLLLPLYFLIPRGMSRLRPCGCVCVSSYVVKCEISVNCLCFEFWCLHEEMFKNVYL